MVTKSRECPDYKKFVLEILKSHLAFCLVTLPERLAFSPVFVYFLVFVSLSSSFVSFLQLCRFLPALSRPLRSLIAQTHTIRDNGLPWTRYQSLWFVVANPSLPTTLHTEPLG